MRLYLSWTKSNQLFLNMSSHQSKLSELSFNQVSLRFLWQRLLCFCVLNMGLFWTTHLLISCWRWQQQSGYSKGGLATFLLVSRKHLVWGQSNDGDVSPPQHQELLEAKGKGINFNKHALCASPGVKAPYCYCTFSPNIPAEKILWHHTWSTKALWGWCR